MDTGWVYKILQPYLKLIKGRRIAIWGMGNVGMAVKEVLQENDNSLRIEYFDSQKHTYQNPIFLDGKFLKYYIIITPMIGYSKIEKQVQGFGYQDVDDYICLGKFADIREFPWNLYALLKKDPITFPEHDGERLFIFGNGPSVNYLYERNRAIIQKNKCMCVNFIGDSEFYEKIQPRYYVIVDKYAFLYDEEEDENRSAITKKAWEAILKKTNWSMILFMPHYAKKNQQLMKKIEANTYINSYFFCSDNFSDTSGKWKNEKFTLYTNGYLAPLACNVIISAIFLGIKLGYTQLYLLGADISWISSIECGEDNIVYFQDNHCYDLKGNKTYHAYGPHMNDMACIFEALSNVFKGCKDLNEYALKNNINIYNMNINSYIDAFKKIKFIDE